MCLRNSHFALIRDFRDEGWPSMDLCADQLLEHWPATDISPSFIHLATQFSSRNLAFNADRLFNRFVRLPVHLKQHRQHFNAFHIVDHTYAHLVHSLPAQRTGVYCHDLDAFRSILQPETEKRPWWFRRLAQRTLSGLQRAAIVFHSTTSVREQLLRNRLVHESRLVHAPYGVAEEFTPESKLLAERPLTFHEPYLLNVGSNIPRKRLDVLLEVFAGVRQAVPELRLVQVGGPWPAKLLSRIEQFNLKPFITQIRGLSRDQLAELYRHASAVLVTSEAEGFGLPVIEALACGSVVIASDIPTLREAGGNAATYCPVAKVEAWTETVTRLFCDPRLAPTREARLTWAARFRWKAHAEVIANAYQELACTSFS